MSATADEPATTPSGGRTTAEIRTAADDLRKRVDLFGKTLGAIATLGTTAVGLNKIADLFPAEHLWKVVVACLALIAAGFAALVVAARLMRVAGPVFVSEDPPSKDTNPDGLDAQELEAVGPVLNQAAQRFGYTSLPGLAEREHALRRSASQALNADERARRTGLADAVKTEIETALARAQLVVVRRRARNAVGDTKAFISYGVVLVGLVGFAAFADWAASDRREIADAKACAEARKAGATAEELRRTGNICEAKEDDRDKPAAPLSEIEARAKLTEQLSTALAACAALVAKGTDAKRPLESVDCEPVQQALAAISASP